MFRTLPALTTLLAIACLAADKPAQAQNFEADFEYVQEFRESVLYVTLDDSHDLVHIGFDGNDVEFVVMMFDPSQFAEIPATWDLNQLEELATEVYDYAHSADELDRIEIECLGGHDFVWCTNSFPVRLGVDGGPGDDILYGGGNSDTLFGGSDDDDLYGQDGFDLLVGGANDDRLYGGADSDELIGDSGLDRLYGEAGADVLDGSKDFIADVLTGGADADTFIQHYTVFTLNTTGARLPVPSLSGAQWRLAEDRITDKTPEDTVEDGDY